MITAHHMRLWTLAALASALLLLAVSVVAHPRGVTAQTAAYSSSQCTPYDDGKVITVGVYPNGRFEPDAVTAAVADAIRRRGLPYTPPSTPLVRSTGGTGGGNRWDDNGTPDLATLTAVCNVLGYKHYVTSTCPDDETHHLYPNGKCNYHSPHDNQLTRFTGGDFHQETAEPKYGKTWISSITCKDSIDVCLPSSSSSSVSSRDAECRDGMDNDNDGVRDYPDDFSCANPNDDDETHPKAQCQDGKDNDGDGLVDYPNDPGCFSRQDNDEFNAVSSSSSSSSPQPITGCIDVIKETFDTAENPFTPVPQFAFHLDGGNARYNDGSGRIRYTGVSKGFHRVHEDVQQDWGQLSITPTNGDVFVDAGVHCAVVVFKNKQRIMQSSSSSISSSSSSYSSSSAHWWYPVTNIDTTSTTTVESEINAISQNVVNITQNGDGRQEANVNNNAQTNVDSTINAASQNIVNIRQQAAQWFLPVKYEYWKGQGFENNPAFLREKMFP